MATQIPAKELLKIFSNTGALEKTFIKLTKKFPTLTREEFVLQILDHASKYHQRRSDEQKKVKQEDMIVTSTVDDALKMISEDSGCPISQREIRDASYSISDDSSTFRKRTELSDQIERFSAYYKRKDTTIQAAIRLSEKSPKSR